jgi:multicomponent Na+:H+ antiporter subunit C
MNHFAFMVALWIFVVGLYGVASSRNLIHMVVCLSIVQSSTYVLLLSIGWRVGGHAPIFDKQPVGTLAVDPVVQALALTDIVVGATVMALLLAMAVQVYKHRGSLDPTKLRPMQG